MLGLSRRSLLAAGLLVATSLVLIAQSLDFSQHKGYLTSPAKGSNQNRASSQENRVVIPNIVHYVYMFKEGVTDFNFKFRDFLTVHAASIHWNPDVIYLHTNAPDDAIERARNGETGKWNKLMFHTKAFKVNKVKDPKVAGNGDEIKKMEHKSDFVRLDAVREFGGVYLDFDAHPVRDIKYLRESGFKSIFGRQYGGRINNGVFMGVPESKLLTYWHGEMNRVFATKGWAQHGNGVLTRICPRFQGHEPGEVLILEHPALNRGSWRRNDLNRLLEVHDEERSNLLKAGSDTEEIEDGDPLPDHLETMADKWDHPDKFPKWATDWSSSFVLHAFYSSRNRQKPKGYHGIDPRYILDRRSNFARAMYPVVKDMWDRGMVSLSDTESGKPPAKKPKPAKKEEANDKDDKP